MSRQERLEQLLARWDELREEGQEVSAEKLAADSPELLDELSNSAERPGLDDDVGRADNLERRIAFQEELDWAWYRSFGLLEEQVANWRLPEGAA